MLDELEEQKFRTLFRNHIIGVDFHDLELQRKFALKMVEMYRIRVEVYTEAIERLLSQRDYKQKQAKDE